MAACRDIVGQQLDQARDLHAGLLEQGHARECPSQGLGGGEHQVMPPPQVRLFVGEHGGDLFVGERVQRASGDDRMAVSAGQAVHQALLIVHHECVEVAVVPAEQRQRFGVPATFAART